MNAPRLNGEQLATLRLLADVLAGRLKKLFNEQALAEVEAGRGVPTWRRRDATIAGSSTHDRVEVVEESAFMRHLAKLYPEQVAEMTVLVVRSATWLEERRAEWVLCNEAREDGTPALDEHGREIPGTAFRRGGEYQHVSFTPTHDARRRANRLVDALLAGVLVPELVTESDRTVIRALLGELDAPPV